MFPAVERKQPLRVWPDALSAGMPHQEPLLFARKPLRAHARKLFHVILNSARTAAIKRTYDSYGLELLRPITDKLGYLPWTSSAMRPGAICHIVNDIVLNNRKRVIEFGSGLSTLILAHVLSETGGELISFDEDESWVRLMTERLSGASGVKLVHAPLTRTSFSNQLDWYDPEIVERAIAGAHVDLMCVDGPKAFERGKSLARYPAVPFLKGHLAESSTVILDDIQRPGERRIFHSWEQELATPGRMYPLEGGHGVITMGRTFFAGL